MTFKLPEELIEYYGIEKEFDSFEDFKEWFPSEFTRNSNIYSDENIKKRINGSTFSKIARNKKEIAKEFGLEYTNSELEKMTLEEIYRDSLSKLKDIYEGKVSEAQKQATEPSEALEDFKKKLEKEKNEKNQFKTINETLLKEFEDYKKTKENEFKSFKIGSEKNNWFGKIKFKSDMSEIEKAGFDKYLSDNYVFDFDENNEPIVTDKKGNRIANEKVTGKFKSPIEVIEDDAKKHNLIVVNQLADKNTKQPTVKVDVNNKENGSLVNGRQRVAVTKPFGV